MVSKSSFSYVEKCETLLTFSIFRLKYCWTIEVELISIGEIFMVVVVKSLSFTFCFWGKSLKNPIMDTFLVTN